MLGAPFTQTRSSRRLLRTAAPGGGVKREGTEDHKLVVTKQSQGRQVQHRENSQHCDARGALCKAHASLTATLHLKLAPSNTECRLMEK